MGIFTPDPLSTLDVKIDDSTDNVIATEGLDTATALESNDTATTEVNADASLTQTADVEGNKDDVIATPVIEQAADPVVEEITTPTAEAIATLEVKRSASNKAYGIIADTLSMSKLGRRTEDLRGSLRDARMVQSFAQVAQEHNLSAPLVAAFRAAPGFDQAVVNFPDTTLFNIIPEHPTQPNSVAGLESFETATTNASDSMKAQATAVVAAFGDILATIPATVQQLKAQIAEDVLALESSDITDDVLATLPVASLSDASFNETLGKAEMYLKTVKPFNTDSVQANPETIVSEIKGLESLVGDVGQTFGMTLDQYGIRDADRGEAYEPVQGSFADKDITVPSLNLFLSRSDAVLDALQQVADRKDDLISAAMNAVSETPAVLNSDDVTYGALDHVTLLSCYTTFVSKLVSESVRSVATVLSTVDAVLDIDTGIPA